VGWLEVFAAIRAVFSHAGGGLMKVNCQANLSGFGSSALTVTWALTVALALALSQWGQVTASASIIRTTMNGIAAGQPQTSGPADAEVREESPTTARGDINAGAANAELATRRGTTQNSAILLRFDISGITLADVAANPNVLIRLHVNTTSWTPARSNSTPGPPPTGTQFGLEYHALNLTAPGQNWDEATVTYTTAPGLTLDSNVVTKDYNADTTLLGTLDYLPIHVSNHLPVGYAWDFSSPNLTSFLQSAITNGNTLVTFLVGVNNGATGYNYIFGSNDASALLNDTAYDPDGAGPLPSGPSPNSGASNANGDWAPKLILNPVPEPSSIVLLAAGAAGLAAVGRLRRK
jgi:PEP-CTERM motif